MTKFYIVRHGQTDYNKRQIIQGKMDIELNDVGKEQAKKIAESLAGVNFDVIYYSPLTRAKQTAEELRKYHKMIQFLVAPEIMERGFGSYEGKSLNFELPLWDYHLEQNYIKGGETMEKMKERVYPFLDKIVKERSDQTVCLVCHGGTVFIIREYFEGVPKSGNLMDFASMQNGEAMIFEK